MRIAFIAPFGLQPKGTVSARMVPLACALARRGHDVRIVIPPWDDPSTPRIKEPTHETRATGDPASRRVELVTLSLPERMPYSIGLTAGLVREALAPRRWAEVAHVFKPIGYSGLAGLPLAALRVPWVLDTDDWEGPGGWADVNPYARTQRAAVTVQEAALPRIANAVTAASRTLEARAWDFGLPRDRVFYLPNGVDAEDKPDADRSRAVRKKHGLEGRPVLLLYTRFAEFPWLWPLRIMERVVAERPEAALLVVGSGFFGEEKRLREEANTRGLARNVVITGRVAESEVRDYMASADVALYPMADTLLNRAKSPVKVLEPMSAGLPLVAHKVGQAAEFIRETGVLVEPGDLEGMADAALALLSDPGRREKLGKLARARVIETFSWGLLAATAEEAYRVALSPPGKAR